MIIGREFEFYAKVINEILDQGALFFGTSIGASSLSLDVAREQKQQDRPLTITRTALSTAGFAF